MQTDPTIHSHYLQRRDLEGISPKDQVEKLITEGFLDEFRRLPDIRNKIFEKIRRVIPNASLHPTLMLLIKQNKLTREKLEGGLWGYRKKRENE